MTPSSYIDVLRPTCDAIDCTEDAKYEREITVKDMQHQPFTFTAFFCEKHKDEAHNPWDEIGY